MRTHVLFEDPRVSLTRVDHPADAPHRDPEREESEAYAVSFVEQGSFHVHSGTGSWRLARGAVFVTRPGLRYRCSHDSETPDDVCLSIHCSADLVEEAARVAGRRWDDVVPVAPLTNRLAYLHRQLDRAIADGVAPMAVPSLAHEIVSAVVGPRPDSRLHRAGQLAWYADRVGAAREIMEHRFHEPLALEALAREVGISPFHFSRVFRELVGTPLHRYLVRVRLARAAEALRGGATVTAASHGAGFPNLGHFIRQFRRAYGVTPSRYGRSSAD